ncbi:metabotropic glutamate receptor 2 [Trichonephila inaurata madagascariensis]|uniref:Metabotropic glutamate receptor 2 n=1 Tax=Trichonephila inaurata madagascariensis TaxID=2747483 RepID=A0A8X6JP06_9ARAC|nr:metabotropic glutamate receptor 2 [Trichonephila inaurata madagascariensis]
MANKTPIPNDFTPSLWTPNATHIIPGTSFINCSLINDNIHRRKESWVIPLVVLCTINITAILLFEVYVLYKSCGSRRHLFLGQILLLGLFLSSLLGFAFVPTPSWFTCALIRAGVGIAYVLIFATLLVKCVFLFEPPCWCVLECSISRSASFLCRHCPTGHCCAMAYIPSSIFSNR